MERLKTIAAFGERTAQVSELLTDLLTGLDTLLQWWDAFQASDLVELRDAPNFDVSLGKLVKLFRELRISQPKLNYLRKCYKGARQRVYFPSTPNLESSMDLSLNSRAVCRDPTDYRRRKRWSAKA